MGEIRKQMVHELKCWPRFFKEVESGRKLFEIRQDDRDFQADDDLILREWDPTTKLYSGKSVRSKVTYVLRNTPPFTPPGYCVMSLESPILRGIQAFFGALESKP